MNTTAVLEERHLGGSVWTLRLADGTPYRARRADIPIKGMLKVGDKLEVRFVARPVISWAQKKPG